MALTDDVKKTKAAKANQTKKTRQTAFLAAYIENGAHVRKAATACDIPLRTVQRWFAEDQKFKARIDEAFADFEHELLACAIQRAKGGSDTLLIFLLKATNPKRYCDQARKEALAKTETSRQLFELPNITFGTYGTPGFETLDDEYSKAALD